MKACPTCNRPFGGAKRTCFACRKPILKKHRWHIEGFYILHDDCSNPTMRVLVRVKESDPILTVQTTEAAAA